MAKSQLLNFTQNLNNVYIDFYSSDLLRVVTVSPNNNGSNLTSGTRTFTAAAGTLQTGASAATWTATVTDSRVIGAPVITNQSAYLVTPTATGNAATVDSGSTNATFNLRVEYYKELYTASTDDAVIKTLNVASLDSAARVMSLWIVGTDAQPVLIGAVNIPANSGNNGTAATVDLLGGTLMPSLPYDANGKRIIMLKAGQKLALSVPAVTAGTQINVTAQIEQY
jgi:hypothetical protein